MNQRVLEPPQVHIEGDGDAGLSSDRAWRIARHMTGCTLSTVLIDQLLDERSAATLFKVDSEKPNQTPRGSRGVVFTGAFLAESATIVDHELNVTGGVLEHYTVNPTQERHLVVVILTQTQTQTQTGETTGDFQTKV